MARSLPHLEGGRREERGEREMERRDHLSKEKLVHGVENTCVMVIKSCHSEGCLVTMRNIDSVMWGEATDENATNEGRSTVQVQRIFLIVRSSVRGVQ